MLWVERIAEPAKVQAELDVYNELMPGEAELSATLFVEITEASEIRPTLERLVGLDARCCWCSARSPTRRGFPRASIPRQLEAARISAVQYLRFPLDARARARFADPRVRARLRVEHPSYRREEEIPPAVRAALIASLAREPEPLLQPQDTPATRREHAPRGARGALRSVDSRRRARRAGEPRERTRRTEGEQDELARDAALERRDARRRSRSASARACSSGSARASRATASSCSTRSARAARRATASTRARASSSWCAARWPSARRAARPPRPADRANARRPPSVAAAQSKRARARVRRTRASCPESGMRRRSAAAIADSARLRSLR